VILYVLGAPGAGKTSLAAHLRTLLPDHVVIDWDAFMGPASELATRDIRTDVSTWAACRALIRSIVETVGVPDVVVLGVSTPEELSDWPQGRWLLLDCSDEERRRRLSGRGSSHDPAEAIKDARSYRSLGLPVLDTTGQNPTATAVSLTDFIRSVAPAP
jgi:broad-specificity NMP kinase